MGKILCGGVKRMPDDRTTLEQRVLLLAPTERDAATSQDVLRAGLVVYQRALGERPAAHAQRLAQIIAIVRGVTGAVDVHPEQARGGDDRLGVGLPESHVGFGELGIVSTGGGEAHLGPDGREQQPVRLHAGAQRGRLGVGEGGVAPDGQLLFHRRTLPPELR